jgi:UDP-3-O-[3-hydroxymyristoyl] glucosamine N-acyltransferase
MKWRVADIAQFLEGEIVGDADTVITGISGITEAREGDLSFVAQPKYAAYVSTTKASALIVSREFAEADIPLIRVDNPYLAFARFLTHVTQSERTYSGVAEGAFVHTEADVADEVIVMPHAYVGRGAVIKPRAVVHPGVYVGDGAIIGEETILYPNVTVMERCIIGDRVIIHAGTVIGSDGFGFAHDGSRPVKIPQVGIVRIDDDVEIGSNCSIDRAALGVTWIKSGVIMDNLVQVGHNVVVEENSIIISQVGISGSTHIGKNVILTGQAGLLGHLTIGDGAIVTPKAGISRNVDPGEVVSSGLPQLPHKTWLRVVQTIPRLPEIRKELNRLRKRVEELERMGREDDESAG